jgi:AraC-like DNA-binding protein
VDGIVLRQDHLRCPISNSDPTIYDMATAFIETRGPARDYSIHAHVRRLLFQYLGRRDNLNILWAAVKCGLHSRTLQRRLRAEGISFEEIKDEVRRSIALHYIQNTDMPLKLVIEKLDYAEISALTRSCYRWFSVSPRELRRNGGHSAARKS